ncbi:tail fiber domain-containing protein [Candidatus Zixiibacteriota bacterium]
MQRRTLLYLSAVLILLGATSTALADVPPLINYQGVLLDSGGNPVTTPTNVFFSIWDAPLGGAALWYEAHSVTPDANGLISVLLGSAGYPIPDTAFNGAERYLNIKVGADPDITPRLRLASAPYAFRVATVDGATGGIISGDVSIQSDLAVDGDITATGKATIGPGHTSTGGKAFAAGEGNSTTGNWSSASGFNNIASGNLSTIGGGTTNQATLDWTVVGGGQQNQATAAGAAVVGGNQNIASANFAFVGGGVANIADGVDAAIVGGQFNNASGDWSAVGGGKSDTAGGDYATVGGGKYNVASGNFAVVAGGGGDAFNLGNRASGQNAAIGGGFDNTAIGDYATISGGSTNNASAVAATISGGNVNSAGASASVGGGGQNDASGMYGTIPGGYHNSAEGEYSFAAGRKAKALDQGTFVWADDVDYDFSSAAIREFAARATGGVRFVTGVDGSGVPDAGVQVAAGGGSWSSISDRNLKENLSPVDAEEILAKLVAMPISTWNYRAQDESIRHIGPMAQDLYAAFGVGESDRLITTVDADGIALAAIQALDKKTRKIEELEDKVARLEAVVQQLLEERR